jgi:hypothetical protein
MENKFKLHYVKDGDDFVVNVRFPAIILQDVSIERIKKKLPQIYKSVCKHQLKQMENGIELIKDGDWKDLI